MWVYIEFTGFFVFGLGWAIWDAWTHRAWTLTRLAGIGALAAWVGYLTILGAVGLWG